MSDPRANLCHRARAFSGGNHADTVAEGVIVSVCTEPTYTIRTADGEQVHSAASLTEVGEFVPDADIPPAAETRRAAPMPARGLSVASWQDVSALHDEVMRLRRDPPDATQALTVHWWGRQIPRDAGAVARQSVEALERAGFEVRRRADG